MDATKNFAYSTVLTAPSSPTAGTTLVVQSGDGAKFPTAPFDLTLYPVGTLPLIGNAEIVRCTNVSTDTLTIVRAQYGTSAQTVAVGWAVDNAVTAALLAQLLALSNYNAAGKNVIINGAMDFWQRATSFASISTVQYTADRWMDDIGDANWTVSRIASGLTGFQYAMRFQRNSGSTSTVTALISQSLESSNAIPLAGQVVTLSFYARCGANFSPTSSLLSVQMGTGTGTDENFVNGYTGAVSLVNSSSTLTTSWQRFSFTATVGTTATELGIWFRSFATGTAGANDYFDITGVQLEIGANASVFSRSGGTIGDELELCQRYYCQFTAVNLNDPISTGVAVATTASNLQWQGAFPVVMRKVPTLTASATNTLKWYSNTGPNSISAVTINQSTTTTFGISCTVSSATAGAAYVILGAAAAFVGFTAEL